MLDWLTKNPQILIFVVFGVIALFGQLAKFRQTQREKAEKQRRSANPPAQTQRHSFDTATMDSAEAERTRRIQEELRRKILARMQGTQPGAQTPMPRPSEPPIQRSTSTAANTAVKPPPLPGQKPAQKPIFDESENAYRSATEKLAELQAMNRDASAHKDEIFGSHESETAHAESSASGSNLTLQSALRDPNELRRAFILREILGEPVALKK